uniref:Uncharacterized protein n=1 Tax=Timema monikensis TaxID=170555 RepID=A0A7R9HSL4_9NEOP|nr:unnamed protein product [Timema monikensis]
MNKLGFKTLFVIHLVRYVYHEFLRFYYCYYYYYYYYYYYHYHHHYYCYYCYYYHYYHHYYCYNYYYYHYHHHYYCYYYYCYNNYYYHYHHHYYCYYYCCYYYYYHHHHHHHRVLLPVSSDPLIITSAEDVAFMMKSLGVDEKRMQEAVADLEEWIERSPHLPKVSGTRQDHPLGGHKLNVTLDLATLQETGDQSLAPN